jgi:hypothetical protein
MPDCTSWSSGISHIIVGNRTPVVRSVNHPCTDLVIPVSVTNTAVVTAVLIRPYRLRCRNYVNFGTTLCAPWLIFSWLRRKTFSDTLDSDLNCQWNRGLRVQDRSCEMMLLFVQQPTFDLSGECATNGMLSQKVPGMVILHCNGRYILQRLCNRLQSRTLAYTHTWSIYPAIVGSTDGRLLLESCGVWPLDSIWCPPWLRNLSPWGPYSE